MFLDKYRRTRLQNPLTDSNVAANLDVSVAPVVLLLKINVKHYQDFEVSCGMFVFSGSSKSAN
jgi:hypothetical protein